ncbi:putative nucleic acid-binding protein [Haloarcula quadrata]|uniref:Ribonuclease VapC n=2 Tax=Haloarcula TaxID=2237 RepID=A0A495R603_9EURY|nr:MULTISPECIES: type II toxin-antitoxin system VapC family toxin [Haloarcula]EMA12508.1 PilT protein domain protein [Haloarcula californiae ATCC 33799]RKS82755.1 putative nucleic acid-binding protein [Haloarcula quadrata]
MADVVIDTSTVVKWYIPEQDHEQARALRDDFLNGKHDLCAPALMPFEAVNALTYSGHYDGERLHEAANSLDNYGIELVSFGSVGPIAEITNSVDITAYDAAYVALAVKRDATAYTADGNLLQDVDGTEYADTVAHIRTY